MMKSFAAASLLTVLITSPLAWSHGDASEKRSTRKPAALTEETAFGRPGDPKRVIRTIQVEMKDEMKFLPNGLKLKRGDTVKFVVRNSGKVMHEMVIGTLDELKKHADLMKMFPDMEHDEPYMAHVAPGKIATIVWEFNKTGEFHYGCLVPGHFEAGMVGRIVVN